MKRFFLLGAALAILGCETNPAETGPSLKERIAKASESVQVVDATNPNWCATASNCKYLGELYCDANSVDGAKKCMKKLRKRVVKHGGDTFVQQAAGEVRGARNFYDDGYHRIYGQAYSCNNTNQALGTEYRQKKETEPLSQVKMLSKAYAAQCKATEGCTLNHFVRTCASVQKNPFKLCREKLARENEQSGALNLIELKDDVVNNAAFYRMFLSAYKCP